jgi:hypothetical protein
MSIISKFFGKKTRKTAQEPEMAVKNEENQQMVSSHKVVSCKKKSKKQRKKERERLNLKQKQSVKQNTSTGKVVNVYHVIVLDESGSMTCVTHQTISGLGCPI